uniref:Small ribosomal subunit protein uS2 n=1 Tax=Meloidogyne incognita TaxID=6306 RepID=A0A914KKI1_MELIC
MSNGLDVFNLTDDEAMKLLVCESHVGTKTLDYQMENYVWKRRADGVNIINIRKLWEKLLFAARAIAAIENPADVVVVSALGVAQRAILKFASHTGATPIVGRFTPGSLTNQIQKNFKEPRLLVVSDPRIDHQALTEASYVNVPVIAFCNTDSPLKFIDIAIPCNLKNKYSIGLVWWLLAREVLLLRGKISRQTGFVVDGKYVMPDLYFHRDPQEAEKEEPVESEHKETWPQAIEQTDYVAPTEPVKLDFNVPLISDWAAASEWPQEEEAQVAPTAPIGQPQPQQQQTQQGGDWNSGTSGW